MYTALEPVNPNTWTGWQDLVETRDNADSGATTYGRSDVGAICKVRKSQHLSASMMPARLQQWVCR